MHISNNSTPLGQYCCRPSAITANVVGVALAVMGILAACEVGSLAHVSAYWYCFEIGTLVCFAVACIKCKNPPRPKTELEQEIDYLVGEAVHNRDTGKKEEAMHYYEQAADKGDLASMCVLAVHYFNKNETDKGWEWAEKVAPKIPSIEEWHRWQFRREGQRLRDVFRVDEVRGHLLWGTAHLKLASNPITQ